MREVWGFFILSVPFLVRTFKVFWGWCFGDDGLKGEIGTVFLSWSWSWCEEIHIFLFSFYIYSLGDLEIESIDMTDLLRKYEEM